MKSLAEELIQKHGFNTVRGRSKANALANEVIEQCAVAADEDVNVQTGVIADYTNRCDGGASYSAARRIAARIRALKSEPAESPDAR